jgi:serine/threonine protein kinase
MNHPNIMILHDFFVEDKFYYLVTEFMEGGELFDRIVEKVGVMLPRSDGFYRCVSISLTVSFCPVVLQREGSSRLGEVAA